MTRVCESNNTPFAVYVFSFQPVSSSLLSPFDVHVATNIVSQYQSLEDEIS
jgi:hypothetical protein